MTAWCLMNKVDINSEHMQEVTDKSKRPFEPLMHFFSTKQYLESDKKRSVSQIFMSAQSKFEKPSHK